MCLQISYTLTCEHVKTQTIYCADAQPAPALALGCHHHRKSLKKDNKRSYGSGSGSKRRKSPSSPTASPTSCSVSASPALTPSSGFPSSTVAATANSRSPECKMLPCHNLTQQSLPYPTPPSFACDPQTAATSLLAPKCPLPDCPFEVKNRCWNCCWCGKSWNERGRCSCVIIIEGNEVHCEHICCPECEAAKS